MADQSPPKRITRARAAAKNAGAGAGVDMKTTKIATASSRAKVTRATSTKRKTRSEDVAVAEAEADEQQEEEEEHLPQQAAEPELKSTRGRAKKPIDPESEMDEAPLKPTRGRPKKVVIETPATESTRPLRGRAKKADVPEEEEAVEVVEEPVKRTTRGRAPAATKAAAPKKTVKFEEPDKENIVPAATDVKIKVAVKEAPATGLRAKPVRKPAATRATRGRKAVEEAPKTSPLSPKKITQVSSTKDSISEDELATSEKTPMKPLMKSPVKPPGSVFGTAKKLDFSSNSISVYNASVPSRQGLQGSIMASPARRPPQSPFKETMKISPQRALLSGSILQSPFKPSFVVPQPNTGGSSFKTSMLQSPARRPQSPTKVSDEGSPTRGVADASIFAATPRASAFKISRFATPKTLNRSIQRSGDMPPPTLPAESSEDSSVAPKEDAIDKLTVTPALKFTGRLSSIMPRDADPAFSTSEPAVQEQVQQPISESEQSTKPLPILQTDTIEVHEYIEAQSSTPPLPLVGSTTGAFSLRHCNESPFEDSDSEDELASNSPMYSPAPLNSFGITSPNYAPSLNLFTTSKTTPKNSTPRSIRSEQKAKIGFTPLAKQLSDWMGTSPDKSDKTDGSNPSSPEPSPSTSQANQDKDDHMYPALEPSPVKSSFFEDEMTIRDELVSAAEQPPMEPDFLEAEFEPIDLDEEDLALANEADEMSMLEPDQIEASPHAVNFATDTSAAESMTVSAISIVEEQLNIDDLTHSQELDSVNQFCVPEDTRNVEELTGEDVISIVEQPAPSEASQEYGDENVIPVDPVLMSTMIPQPQQTPINSTPKRVLSERICHTVSKVPLKPADEETPMRALPAKRSVTVSRLPAQRPNLGRSNTVISYSPKKSTPRSHKKPTQDAEMRVVSTPSKADGWSTMATPTRTPRRDLDTGLLKGAVVFVDVHTTEGADASVLFIELLTQMGARCVKTWNWNGHTDDGSKIGVTHVVFKDGGKRTLERVKQSGGVVCCVGVGWVLDCERENKWLDESPYVVDSGTLPRGGSRRRKSMEPRALANLNGTLISSTPSRNFSPSKEFFTTCETPVTSKSRRRDSVQWMPSPASPNDQDEQTLLLSPVPTTPAPDVISAYAEDGLFGDTPGGQTPYFLHKEQLVQKTAPVKKHVDLEQGDEDAHLVRTGFLSQQKDESVMMRLMAARRKSLQFAPKVGSPLARRF